MLKIVVVFSVFVGVSFGLVCMRDVCQKITCDPNIIAANCDGRFAVRGGFCGCCDACIKQLDEGDTCAPQWYPGAPDAECKTGLSCDFPTRKCISVLKPCEEARERKKKLLEEHPGISDLSMPSCSPDGYFAPTQCVGFAFCYCVTANGKQIDGYSGNWSQARLMGCQCARDKFELETDSDLDGRYVRQCDQLGNYQPRQCHEAACNCVDRNGNPIDGYSSHVSQASKMTCECARRNSDIVLLGMNCIPHKCDALGNFIQTPRSTAC